MGVAAPAPPYSHGDAARLAAPALPPWHAMPSNVAPSQNMLPHIPKLIPRRHTRLRIRAQSALSPQLCQQPTTRRPIRLRPTVPSRSLLARGPPAVASSPLQAPSFPSPAFNPATPPFGFFRRAGLMTTHAHLARHGMHRNINSANGPKLEGKARCAAVATDAATGLEDGPTPLPSMSEVLVQYDWMLDAPLEQLMSRAAALRDSSRHGGVVSFSPKVFLPLTRLCRDSCGYCTFAQPPRPGRRAYMTLEEVLQVASLGAAAGCSEALITLGDKPEDRWAEAVSELREMGYGSTLEYVEAVARAVLRETGLLPHINAGVMGEEEIRRLKKVSASQGLMLESTSLELMKPGAPHHNCPDKHPAVRLATIEAAGRAAVPYTSGILVGIGDTRADRLHALACLYRLHERYGHIQELIIQNFRAQPSTSMCSHPEPPLEELLWGVAVARIMFGPHMNIQVAEGMGVGPEERWGEGWEGGWGESWAPPNLTPLESLTPPAPAAAPGPVSASNAGGSSGSNTDGSGGGDGSVVPQSQSQSQLLESLQGGWRALLNAGINDWGGISPITRDFINPDKPWPHLAHLAATTASAAKTLLPRLPIYPGYLGLLPGGGGGGGGDPGNGRGAVVLEQEGEGEREREGGGGRSLSWLDFSGGRESVGAAVFRSSDSEGFLRASDWVAGQVEGGPQGGSRTGPGVEALEMGLGSGIGRPGLVKGGELGSGRRELQTDAGQHRRQQHQQQKSAFSPAVAPATVPVLGAATDPPTAPADAGFGRAVVAGAAGSRPAVPLPRGRTGGGTGGGGARWRVAVGMDGSLQGAPRPADPSPRVVRLLEGVLSGGRPLQLGEIELLLRSRGADHEAVCTAADELRRRTCGDTVSYVVNRNINYTNVCTYKCSFCAFSKGRTAEELRGPAYVVPYDEIARRTAEAWDRGATEASSRPNYKHPPAQPTHTHQSMTRPVCMQGGIHPEFSGATYLAILSAAKSAAPHMHVHAFSPLEVHHGATSMGLTYESYLERLAVAGLGSLPGTAAEVLHDSVRGVLCPDKIDTATWVKVVSAAHRVGLRTTSTLMFGSVEEGPLAWAQHLVTLREVQQRAQAAVGEGAAGRGGGGVGFTEFVPLPFVHMEAPVYLQGRARRGPSLHEGVLLHAVARLALHPLIPHIQASWVKMGPSRAAELLGVGCDDMGGSIMNESITRAAGATHGQELAPLKMEEIIRGAGRQPRQRTTLYGTPPAEQTARSYMFCETKPRGLGVKATRDDGRP
ncbi:hypothetical protein VOLCADRAFT_96978 [Volvox carteri f. nagariensis]|uniref:7,8-didemethyl-8-hydroxy-5-deazariboflavin synthase n=1 Tax=Volvox carteri f. nagariensis TaxID=3068 RepID=D8UBG9_VOLCA|nr:uncharacterized protein VOLCADRAFT_96978 [Volvox carteri f. nagariensis]EFJ42944.1 hypothetical protein VOLCADRAFT_96978 [Volvox carteri f. nagariensis]|eukprot:XP_002955984.1 hypothetical protein VOLCADRAFT_96978 [Volvox carteri f. nagariensis]